MAETIHLTAGPCVLRPYRAGDEASLQASADHRGVWLNLRDLFPHPYTRADAGCWVASASRQDPPTSFAITFGDQVIGGIGIQRGEDVHRYTAEVGYWLGPDHWGRGIASSALCAFVPWVMERHGLVRLSAPVFAHNLASMRVLEKSGFVREGVLRSSAFKDGKHLDMVLYALVSR